MRAFGLVLAALAVLGLAAGVAQAYTVTHSTQGVLFSDDMEGPFFQAEVGSWGTTNDGTKLLVLTKMKTGATEGGPAAAAVGTDYMEMYRASVYAESLAGQARWQEAIFTEPVSSGTLDIAFNCWINDDWPQILGLDDSVGSMPSLDIGSANMIKQAGNSNWYDYINAANTGNPILPAQWNLVEIHVDLDANNYVVSVNGVAGSTVTIDTPGPISRVACNMHNPDVRFYLDAAPGTAAAVGPANALLCSDDAYVENLSPETNFGTSAEIVVKCQSTGPNRKGYIQWDISSITGTVTAARVDFQNTYSSTGLVQSAEVYLLDDGDVGEGWAETDLTWNNAPGNDLASGTAFDPANTTYLGQVLMPQPVRTGNKLTMSNQALIDAINADTDGNLTLIFAITNQGPTGVTYGSKEDTDVQASHGWTTAFQGPTLIYEIVPEPGTWCLLGFGFITLMVGYMRRSR